MRKTTRGSTMAIARNKIVNPEITAYYHCYSRSVRRAHLTGYDSYLNIDFSHRRKWIEDRLFTISESFFVDICTYAVMSNHYHLVLKLDQGQSTEVSDLDVLKRWSALFQLPPKVAESMKQLHQGLNRIIIAKAAKKYRKRLKDISWFMKSLNEYVAKKANKEDDCTGRFWEGRFKSQALLSERAVLECMKYVDLNPFRAGIAKTIEELRNTGLYQRLIKSLCSLELINFKDTISESIELPVSFKSYVESIVETMHSERKRREITDNSVSNLKLTTSFSFAIGNRKELEQLAQKLGLQWIKGVRNVSTFLEPT